MKKQSFWPKNVILANTCLQNTWKRFPAKIWLPLLPKKSSKIKKYDEIHAYWIQVHRSREDFPLGFEVGRGPRSSINCFLGSQICLGGGAKTLHVSKLTLGQGLATFSYTILFQNYPKSYENEGFRWNLKLDLKTTKKSWPKANLRWKIEAFGQEMSLWPTLAYKAHEIASRPRFGHIWKLQ